MGCAAILRINSRSVGSTSGVTISSPSARVRQGARCPHAAAGAFWGRPLCDSPRRESTRAPSPTTKIPRKRERAPLPSTPSRQVQSGNARLNDEGLPTSRKPHGCCTHPQCRPQIVPRPLAKTGRPLKMDKAPVKADEPHGHNWHEAAEVRWAEHVRSARARRP
jgi:hypothetical protein